MTPRKRNAGLTCAVLTALVASVAFMSSGSPADAQVTIQPRQPGRQFAAWVPPGEYTAFVVTTNADTRNWAISLRTTDGPFPIIVTPQANVIIPFEQGWKVTADAEVRLVSEHIPFGDITAFNQFSEDNPILFSAWGITKAGPVRFVYREVE